MEAVSSSMGSDVCAAYASIQSCMSRFRVDAEFVERTEKIRDDMNRSVQAYQPLSPICMALVMHDCGLTKNALDAWIVQRFWKQFGRKQEITHGNL